MKINQEAIAEFQELYERRFGKKISNEEAQEKGLKLITLIKAVVKPP